MKSYIYTVPTVVLLLCGCQSLQGNRPVAAKMPDPVLTRVIAQQQVLWQEQVINTPGPLPADTIRANTEQVAVDWKGDAVELLTHVARQRGAQFTWTGVRLPLPVNIHAQGVTYQNLLHLVEMQIAWRANLQQLPGELVLAFAPVKPVNRSQP
ncbi:DotD/TraH family lipoprotein [Pseudomonas mosselii]|uniref:DotD/TraH family lipoprotein n=1 Tax=Pseudomonas mosselii TaxID=78327 RepID=A0A7W2JZN0_9PSED|nr:DotD/TraH family lipoprotein [Pseudomonas mosselii]MBA6068124.1 DotD/TraH family lipoprotein [Pseudomonas mosselii]